MTAQVIAETLRPVDALAALIARHGVMRVLLAMPVAALKRRRTRVVRNHELSPHLLRDMGLRDCSSSSKSWELG